MIWTIIELGEDIIVLNNVAKFHLILIKIIRLRERTSLGVTYIRTDVRTYGSKYGRTDGWTGVTLNAPAIFMAGHKYSVLKESNVYNRSTRCLKL